MRISSLPQCANKKSLNAAPRVTYIGTMSRGAVLAIEPEEVLCFVETLLPDGVDSVRVRSLEYVSKVVSMDDLPDGFDAVRVGSTVLLPAPVKP